MEKTKKAIILGAGPAGVITGWLLSRRGWKVDILEKQKMVGGMCRSWKWNKYILDTGPHIFHTPDKKLWNFWNKNFGKLLYKGKYWSKNVLKDKDFITNGEKIVITGGVPVGVPGTTNYLSVMELD